MRFRLTELAAMSGGEVRGADAEVIGYGIDSRRVRPGDLFFAIRGERDGHHFVEAALRAGARAAVVRRDWVPTGVLTAPLLFVKEPAEALSTLAAAARRQWNKTVVAVTGSNGKTTVKELIAVVLSTHYRVARSPGNFNNQLGVPLSVLGVDMEAEVAVLEMGMNHRGEIRSLAEMARPDVGVVTNVSAAHLENFSSVEEIALAKRELIESLSERGTAVLNGDDARVRAFADHAAGRVVTFGNGPNCQIRAEKIHSFGTEGTEFHLRAESVAGRGLPVRIGLPGRHNVMNALAALATAVALDVPLEPTLAALAETKPLAMHGSVQHRGGITIINDCYNSNPTAAAQMIELLRELPGARKIAVLGPMLELGPDEEALHREIGRQAAGAGLDHLVAVGTLGRQMIAGAIEAGFPESNVQYCEATETARDYLQELSQPGDVVLLKASRGVKLEQILEAWDRVRPGSEREDVLAKRA